MKTPRKPEASAGTLATAGMSNAIHKHPQYIQEHALCQVTPILPLRIRLFYALETAFYYARRCVNTYLVTLLEVGS